MMHRRGSRFVAYRVTLSGESALFPVVFPVPDQWSANNDETSSVGRTGGWSIRWDECNQPCVAPEAYNY